MLSHIVSDLHEAYVEEILKPQLGSSNAPKPASSGEGAPKSASDPNEAAVKRIRQAVYDIRYRARREDIPLDQAFNQYMSHTSMSAVEKKAVREKLGMGVGGGGAAPVKEEIQDMEEAKRFLRVDPTSRKTGEKIYYKKFDPSSKKDLADRHKLEIRGIKTTQTQYIPKSGLPYDYQAGEKYEKKFGSKTGKNTVGDLDRDGTVEPDGHEFAGKRDIAIKKSIAKKTSSPAPKKHNTPKKKAFKEGFSNWRYDLHEIINVDDEMESSNEKQIKEKKVNNYSGSEGKRVVNVNPKFNESIENLGGHLIESVELSEDFLIETSNIAADYFFKMGLNNDGLEIVIEDLGLDNFAEFVFELSEEYFLSEELKKSQSKVKTSKAPKGTKQYATTIARVKKQGGTKMSVKDGIASTIRKDRVKKSVEKAKETQSSKKPVRDAIARGIFGAVKAYQSGMERHRKAMGLAKETGKTVAKAAKVTHEAGRRAGESKIGQAVKKVGGAVVKAGVEKVKKDIETTNQALKAKKKVNEAIANPEGVTDRQSPIITQRQKDTVDIQLKNKQKQYGIGEDFDVSTMTPQELQLRKQKSAIEKRLSDIRQRTVRQQKPQEKPNTQTLQTQNSSYEPEGELVDEARASEIRGLGSPESPLSYPGRTKQRELGSRGGRHWQSGGQGGSRRERNKPKSSPQSQAQRLRSLSTHPETPGKYVEILRKKRGGDIGSRFD